ncbi:MAG: hypothetical protein WAW41_05965 [Methylobacter sp.]
MSNHERLNGIVLSARCLISDRTADGFELCALTIKIIIYRENPVMLKPSLRVASIVIAVSLLDGCAFVDKHLFNPAASHASVDPLFRTAECKSYKAPNGKHWLTTLLGLGGKEASTRNISSVVVQDTCDHQTRSINDNPGDEQDRLYFKACEQDGAFNAASCLNYLISKSDEICGIHKSHIYGNRTAVNTTLGVLATGVGVAGAMTGPGAAQALSGTAGFLTGSQSIVNDEVYKNYVTEAILLEINSNREKYLKGVSYLTEAPGITNNIGIGQVRRDALDYHEKCSFYDGLMSLLNKAGDKADKNSAAIERLVAEKAELDKQLADVDTEIAALKGAIPAPDDIDHKLARAKIKKEIVEQKLKRLNDLLASTAYTTPKSSEANKSSEIAAIFAAPTASTVVADALAKLDGFLDTDVLKARLETGDFSILAADLDGQKKLLVPNLVGVKSDIEKNSIIAQIKVVDEKIAKLGSDIDKEISGLKKKDAKSS